MPLTKGQTDPATGEELVTVALDDPHGRVMDPVVEVPKKRTADLRKTDQMDEVTDAEKVRRAAEKLQREQAEVPAQDKRTEAIRRGEIDTGFPDDYDKRLASASRDLQKSSEDSTPPAFEVPDDYTTRIEQVSRDLQRQAARQQEVSTATVEAAENTAARTDKPKSTAKRRGRPRKSAARKSAARKSAARKSAAKAPETKTTENPADASAPTVVSQSEDQS